ISLCLSTLCSPLSSYTTLFRSCISCGLAKTESSKGSTSSTGMSKVLGPRVATASGARVYGQRLAVLVVIIMFRFILRDPVLSVLKDSAKRRETCRYFRPAQCHQESRHGDRFRRQVHRFHMFRILL